METPRRPTSHASAEHDGGPAADVSLSAGGTAVALGVFDGVHRGHHALIGELRSRAREQNLPVVVVTFFPHPMSVVRPGAEPRFLATLPERIRLLKAAGADRVEIIPFDVALSELSAREFVERELVGRLSARLVAVGDNFRFGHRASGDVATLAELGEEYGFEVVTVAVGDAASAWSSSRVRDALAIGDVREAADILGRPFEVAGPVVHGEHRGRELGYPTANVDVDQGSCLPADGVYAGWLGSADERWPAAISIGTNPHFEGQRRTVEAYVLDRDDLDLYGSVVRVEFLERLRAQDRFESLDDLLTAMAHDVERSRDITGC
jgi:riboflavin kinase/FMN adenylyltransferase